MAGDSYQEPVHEVVIEFLKKTSLRKSLSSLVSSERMVNLENGSSAIAIDRQPTTQTTVAVH